MNIEMKPIGRVSNSIAPGQKDVRWQDIVSTVTISPQWAEGLDGITEFSHIIVIFYLDHARDDRPLSLKTHPMGQKNLPEVGIFCTRTPFRPNGIAISTVELLSCQGNELTVKGLDAYDATFVLDIKPYLPRDDKIREARVADWTLELWQMLDKQDERV